MHANNLFRISDFEKKMVCQSPFKMVEHLGCVWLQNSSGLTFYEAVQECQNNGGDVFEFTNYSKQSKMIGIGG